MKNKLSYLLILILFTSCASYEKFRQITEELEIPAQVYQADYNQTWQAVLQIIKNLDVLKQNQEAGIVKTRWSDNTLEVNFADSFASSEAVKAAEYQLSFNISEGYSYGRKITKVTIYKRQRVENDFLQGWREIPTDGIQEQTILYRIGRIISNDNKLIEIDKAREREALENF